MPSTRQMKRLFALARKAGISPDEVKGIVRDRYGHESRKDLSDREYEELCTHLQELTGDRAAVSGRKKPGELANEMEILRFVQTEGLPWKAIALTEHDVTMGAKLLDDLRRRRVRYKRISVRQARKWLEWWSRYPLSIWRAAVDEWMTKHRTKSANYFVGILRGMARDRAAEAAGSRRRPPYRRSDLRIRRRCRTGFSRDRST